MNVIEKVVTNFTREKQSRQEAPLTTGNKIKLYYENQMNSQYKKDEKVHDERYNTQEYKASKRK